MEALVIIATVVAVSYLYGKYETLKRVHADKASSVAGKSSLDTAMEKYSKLDD